MKLDVIIIISLVYPRDAACRAAGIRTMNANFWSQNYDYRYLDQRLYCFLNPFSELTYTELLVRQVLIKKSLDVAEMKPGPLGYEPTLLTTRPPPEHLTLRYCSNFSSN